MRSKREMERFEISRMLLGEARIPSVGVLDAKN